MNIPVEPISVPFTPRLPSPTTRYFSRNATVDPGESNLLKAIRSSLRGSQKEQESFVFASLEGSHDEEELAWDKHTLFLSSGGVIRKRWTFARENQSIQWACVGWFEQPSTLAHPSSARSTHYTSSDIQDETVVPDPNQRPTFGPFTRAERDKRPEEDRTTRYRAIFVFLRGLGKVYFLNGLEYTFYLPFMVRKAWPLVPHGVMIQRQLEIGELEEAALSHEEALPTLFAMVDPFAEASAVGLTASIKHGQPSVLEEHVPGKPIATIPAAEHLVWVGTRTTVMDPLEQLAVTVDLEKHVLSVWHYTYVDPKQAPGIPSGAARRASATMRSTKNPRQSLSVSSVHPLSPRIAQPPSTYVTSIHEQPPLASLPGMPPALSATIPMSAIVPGVILSGPTIAPPRPAQRGRRNSLGQYDVAGDAALGGRIEGSMLNVDPVDSARMRPAYWMERLYSEEIVAADVETWDDITAAVVDNRSDGKVERAIFAVCLPRTRSLILIPLIKSDNSMLKLSPCIRLNALAVAPVKASRFNVYDLLVLKTDGSLSILTHGVSELPLKLHPAGRLTVHPANTELVSLKDGLESSVTLCLTNERSIRISLDMSPAPGLTQECLLMFAMVLPKDVFFWFHHRFLLTWSTLGFVNGSPSFTALRQTIYQTLGVGVASQTTSIDNVDYEDAWNGLATSYSASRFAGDPALKNFVLPHISSSKEVGTSISQPNEHHINFLNGLHHVAQNLLLTVSTHEALMQLVPVICKLALVIRPEWADYWKRLLPHIPEEWPSPATAIIANLDDRLPVWPQDIFSTLYGRINNPEWTTADAPTSRLIYPAGAEPSYAFGNVDPLSRMHLVNAIYRSLTQGKGDTRKRAEAALKLMVRALEIGGESIMEVLPLGLAAPLREAARTCQLSPSGDWPVSAYQLVGRNDLAEVASNSSDLMLKSGYRSVRDYMLPTFCRRSIHRLGEDTRRAASVELSIVTGIELNLEDFTEIRFGQDRRLEEVARMLCSSIIPVIRTADRPELGEYDLAREYQAQAIRLAERTLALPLGRAVFTFGSIQVVTREAYTIPRMEYSVRIYPQNTVVVPENGKVPLESLAWGEFHNGVAAGLRISPTAHGIESSWIKFNKPSELTPEHAGFLFALGLTGHLREMLTWHTFSYLTPKHDLTSIAVLLGLSAANAGNCNRHVTKLLAVHTPALLPTPTVDLNVPMLTQAAGLAGIGLLYMGTKNRRMAEVCLGQLSRRDLIQPDVTNEHREAYTLCAALAFGMVMLGKGSDIPADLVLLSRLRVLIHGEGYSLTGVKASRPSFDVNLTSPAATIALGFMYLRTQRQDVANILTIPDTLVNMEKVPPAQLLLRTLARSLIMWAGITPTNEWISAQVPAPIMKAMDGKFTGAQGVNPTYELAYYNIIAGACFAIGLKYAGTAREEAYALLVRQFDLFSQMAYSQGPQFDHRIKRAAVRDGLNLISISLCMVMAGTGELNCLRRLRYSYGMYNHMIRYGTYKAIHVSLGLLFLGGGRYTLGTSDAAIASMVAAFFPRFPVVSSDNRSYLQALRHLWVLAVEPRCLIARDVDTKEVVYLPVKIKVKNGKEVGTTQFIAPTLIPDVDRLLSLRIDTPRYWPFYLDIVNFPHHKESLIRSQTLYVKRRTAFLSYMEDPKGSRSLFVRSGSSTGDAATLDFPRLKDAITHPAADLQLFISSHSNDPLFLAFADRFCRDDGGTDDEKLFHLYCHATLMDSILQDKSRALQSHLTLYRYRKLSLDSPYFSLAQQDLRFATEFYSKIFDRRFSGRSENNARTPLIRESTLISATYELDRRLDLWREHPYFLSILREYARGAGVEDLENKPMLRDLSLALAWYLQRNSVPVSTLLVILKALAVSSHNRCLGAPQPQGTKNVQLLDAGIKEVLHATGSQLSAAIGTGWTMHSVEDVLATWKMEDDNAAVLIQ